MNPEYHFLPQNLCGAMIKAEKNLEIRVKSWRPSIGGWVGEVQCLITGKTYSLLLLPDNKEPEVKRASEKGEGTLMYSDFEKGTDNEINA